jgi:DHA1 family tetracycline resistance protein-like MFS transporter
LIGPKDKRKTLGAIFVTFGISTLAATILFPILGHLFLGKDGSFLMGNGSDRFKGMLLGFFLAAFPLAQFFFAPIMGDYSDKKGRRGVFLFSVILEAIGYFISALSIQITSLSLLFFGRILIGIAAANTSICLATIVDVSSNESEKIKYFAIGSALIGAMFVLGPFIGGRFSSIFTNPKLVFSMPMWIGALFALFNYFVLLFFFKETTKDICPHPFDILGAYHNIQMAFKLPSLKDLFLIYFFFLFSWNMIYQFLPAFLVQDFHLLPKQIGDIGACFGIIWIGGTIFMQKLAKHFKWLYQLLFFSLVGMSAIAMVLAFSEKINYFIFFISMLIFVCGGIYPILTAAISKASKQGIQGKVLALSQSIQSFSMLLSPFIGGFFLNKNGAIPYFLTAISALVASAILIRTGKNAFCFLENEV